MSETEADRGPIKTHEDGAVRVKVWRNQSHEGRPFYNVTVGRVYKDEEAGEWRETRSLSPDDVLKAQALMGEAYQTIRQEQTLDREYARVQMQEDEPGLSAQRDAAVANGRKPQRRAPDQSARVPRPRRGRQPEQ